jgi:hypothetical protein
LRICSKYDAHRHGQHRGAVALPWRHPFFNP